MRRRLPKFVLLLLATTALALASLSSQRLADQLRPMIEERLAAACGRPVRLGQLTTVALPPGVVLRDLEVGSPYSPDGAPPALWLRLEKLRVRPHWSSLVLGHVVLAEVLAEGLDLQANLQTLVTNAGQGARLPAAAPATGAPNLEQLRQNLAAPWDVHTLRVHEAEVKVESGQGSWVLQGLNVEADWSGIGRRQLVVLLGAGSFAPADRLLGTPTAPIALDASLSAELAGSWARPRRLSLQSATLAAPALDLTLQLGGDVPLALARPEAPLAVTASLSGTLDPLAARLAPTLQLHGQLTLLLSSHGTCAAPSLRAELQGGRWGRGSLPLQAGASLQLLADWTPDKLKLANLQLRPWSAAGAGQALRSEVLQAGSAAATGELSLAAGMPGAATFALAQLDVSSLARAAGFALPTLAGTLSGTVDLRRAAHATTTAVELALQAQDFALREAPRQLQAGEVVLGLDAVGLVASLQASPHRVLVESLELHRKGATVQAEGEALWGPATQGPELDLRIWAGGLPLQALGPIAKVPYEGVAAFAGTLRGPLGRPHAEAAISVDHLRIAQVGLGESHGVLRFAAPVLQLAQFTGKRGSGLLRGDGSIAFARGNNQVAAEFTLRDWDAAETLADLGAGAALSEALDARLWGQVSLQGPLDRPAGNAQLQVPQLSVGPWVLGSADLSCQLARGNARLEADLVTSLPSGNLTAHLGLFDAGPRPPQKTAKKAPAAPLRLAVNVVGGEVALDKVYRNPDGPELAGLLSVRLDLEGPAQALTGTLVSDVTRLQLGGAVLGGVHLLGRAEAGVAKLDVRLLQGGARVAATLGLARPWPLQATADFAALDGQFLLPLLSPAGQRIGREVRAQLTGEAKAAGELADPTSMQASLALQAVELGYHTTQLRLRQPVTLRLVRQKLWVPATSLVDADATLTFTGAVPLSPAGQLDMQTDVEGDLRGLRGLLPGVSNAQGPLQLHVHLRGPLQRPELLGELSLRRASLRFAAADGQVQTLDNLTFKALFSGRGLALTAGRAQLGRGRLRFGGEINLGSGSWAHPEGGLNMHVQLDQVPVTPVADLSATLTGNLELGGRLDAPTLRGDLRLHALRYTARLNLNALVPKRAAPPLRAPFSPFGRPVNLGIKLHAPNDLIISSKVLEAELAADLLVTGTSERIGLLGSVTPKWARARFNQNLFTITHATIDFTDEYRLSPSYSVQAHTRACDIETDVTVQGDVDGYTVQASGRDERGPVDTTDVWSCLNFGLRMSNFSRNTRDSAGIGDALSGSIDTLWVVSGLDDKVRKLLPIHVDELKLTSGWSSLSQRTTARVLVGKELGGKLALRYSRSLEDNDQACSLDYRINNLTTLQANWLSARFVPVGDFGLDTRLHWELR